MDRKSATGFHFISALANTWSDLTDDLRRSVGLLQGLLAGSTMVGVPAAQAGDRCFGGLGALCNGVAPSWALYPLLRERCVYSSVARYIYI